MVLNKEIRKLKISITQECCLRCTHCFVNKAGGGEISLLDARLGLDLFLSSPGNEKKLEIAGGEAFLCFPLFKRIVAMAEALARRRDKKLEIWAASNGLPLTPTRLAFIKKHRIVLSISLYGTAGTHDAIRRLPGGGGSYAPLKARIASVLGTLDTNRVTALLCVHPGHCAALFDDFKGIFDLGFRVINIECVHGVPWPDASFRLFRKNLARIITFSSVRILAGGFIVFENFIQLIKNRQAGGRLACPLFSDLEIYPDGSFSLYPYGFVDARWHSGAIKIGDARSGLDPRFFGCRPGTAPCRTCVRDYYRLPGMRGGARSYAYRTAALAGFFYEMAGGAQKVAFRGYMKKLVKTFA